MVTRQEAKAMRDALKQLEDFESNERKVIRDVKVAVAVVWWNTVKPSVPQTRDEALTAYRFIESLLKTETDLVRLSLLRNKLELANEKYRERKRNG